MAKTAEEIQAQLDEELSKLQALRESILGSETEHYNNLIRDRKELQEKEEQLNRDKEDALKIQEDANEELRNKQNELNSAQETLSDEQLTNLRNEISNLENESRTAQQLHDDTVSAYESELESRQTTLSTFNDSINAFDERMRATEGFSEQDQTVQELESDNQSFKESVSKFSDTIDSFYQSLTGTALAPAGDDPSWVKVIVGAILSTASSEDPFQLEKAREEQTAIEKAQETHEAIEENTRGMAKALEKKEDEKKGGFGGILALLAGAAFGFITAIIEDIWKVGKGIVKLFKWGMGNIGKLFKWVFGGIGKLIKKLIPQKVIDSLTDGFNAVKKFFGKIGGFFKKILGFGGKVDDVADAATGGLSFFGKIKKFFGFLQPVFNVLDNLFKPLKSMFSAGTKIGSKFGKLLGPIGIVITVIDAVVKGVMGFIKGFGDGGGLLGGIKGGLMGIFDSLIGSIVNLGADLIGWILKKFGMEELGQKFMDFDIMTYMKPILDFLFDKLPSIMTSAWESIQPAFTAIGSFFTETVPSIFSSIVERGKAIFNALKPIMVGWFEMITSPFRIIWNYIAGIVEIGQQIFQLFQGFDLWQTIKDGIIGIIPNIFGLKAKVAEMFGTTVAEAQERQTEQGAKFSNFTKNIKEIVSRRIVNIMPKTLGIRSRVAKMLGVPLDDTGDAINMNPAKEEADRRKFVKARSEQMEMQMKSEGATEEEIARRKESLRLRAENEFEMHYDTFRVKGESIVTQAKDMLKETKRDLVDRQKANERAEKEAQKGGTTTAINAPSTTQNNTTVSSDTIAAPAAAQDTAFLQSMAQGLVTQMGW